MFHIFARKIEEYTRSEMDINHNIVQPESFKNDTSMYTVLSKVYLLHIYLEFSITPEY